MITEAAQQEAVHVRPLRRRVRIAGPIVFLDGLSGTGKTMMGPILSSFHRMEVQRMEYLIEHLCASRFLGRIEEDAAVTLLRLCADLRLHDAMIGRESNFRWQDLSSVLSNPRGWRYVTRLFLPDGEPVLERIAREQPILQFHSHFLLGVLGPVWRAFGDQVRVVETVRHPLYLLDFWTDWADCFGKVPRDFAVSFRYGDVDLPWFAAGWEARYLISNRMDRTIFIIEWLIQRANDALTALDESARRRVLVIPFERFVTDPEPHLAQLEGLLGTTRTAATASTLRRQKVPRRLWTDGRDHPIYRRYHWRPPAKHETEAGEQTRRWDAVARQATPEGLRALERLCAEYERRYLQAGQGTVPRNGLMAP